MTGASQAVDVATTSNLLTARGVSVHYGGLKALQEVDIEVPRQAVVGLLGPNGAGKSTLLGVLSGDVQAQAAEVYLDGELVTRLSPQARVRRGLARTFQHPELFGELTVRDHLRLAYRLRDRPTRAWSDPLTSRYLRPEPAADSAVSAVLTTLDLVDVADAVVAGLPLGVCRLVEIGRALATGPKLVLLDEPFSGLNAAESAVLSDALARIVSGRGISMLLVEHDVEIVFGLSSRVHVLDFGRLIAAGTPAEIRSNETVRSAYLGEVEPNAEPVATAVEAVVRTPSATVPTTQKACLRVENLVVNYGYARAIDDVSFSVMPRSVTALLGANGAGKSTIARALAGLVRTHDGKVTFEGTDITNMAPHRIRRLGLAYLPEGRGVFRTLTVEENLRVAVQTVAKGERADGIDHAIELFPVLGARRNQLAGTLSGGEQQMLSLARVLALPPRMLIADEISLGLAPLIVDGVFEGLQRAIDEGVSVIVIEQFVHRALGLADECHVLRRGSLVWSGRASDAHGQIFDLYLGSSADQVEIEADEVG